MADAIIVNKLWETPLEVAYHMTNVSDGTGEAGVAKVTIATLKGLNGAAGSVLALDVKSIRWAIQGMTLVKFNTGANELELSANGYDEPSVTGSNSNIAITTVGAVSGGSYDITVVLAKRPS